MTDPLDCRHVAFTVNRDEREVRCAACKALLDPYAQLERLIPLAEEVDAGFRSLALQQAAQRDRQAFAIERKRKKQLLAARATCELCGGTGWVSTSAGAVVCKCRRAR